MNIEVKLHNLQFKLENIIIPDYSSNYEKMRISFEKHFIDFSSITTLKGEKLILEDTFQKTKKELLENG